MNTFADTAQRAFHLDGQIVLVGATIRGVTLVALPDTFTTTCQ